MKVHNKMTAPDGGWGWIVVLATGLVNMTVFSFDRCSTLFYQELLIKFGKSAGETAITFSITSGLRYFVGKYKHFSVYPVDSSLC